MYTLNTIVIGKHFKSILCCYWHFCCVVLHIHVWGKESILCEVKDYSTGEAQIVMHHLHNGCFQGDIPLQQVNTEEQLSINADLGKHFPQKSHSWNHLIVASKKTQKNTTANYC